MASDLLLSHIQFPSQNLFCHHISLAQIVFLCFLSADSTITVLDLSLNNNFEPLYHINHHFNQAVDSNSSKLLDKIALCDVSAG